MYTYIVVPASVEPASGQAARREPGLKWCRFGDRVIYWTTGVPESSAGRRVRTLGAVSQSSRGQLHLVVQAGDSFREQFPDAPVILDHGRYLAVELSDEAVSRVFKANPACFGFSPLPANATVVLDAPHTGRQLRAIDPAMNVLASQVSSTRLRRSIDVLTGFGTRHSLSEGYQQAADWASQSLSELGYDVSRTPIFVGSGTSLTVIANKPGRTPSPRLVLLTAHLDSINHAGGQLAPAPGADDNGSGAAGLLEIARILSSRSDDQDLRLVLFGGEEEGLLGSRQYVRTLGKHDRERLAGVINMDMIGTLNSDSHGVLLEGAAVSQALIDQLVSSAQDYTSLRVQVSLTPFASDHVPFIEADLPAVLTIEGSDASNPNIHTIHDTIGTINYALACDIVVMNLVTAARLLGTHTSIEDLERWRASTTDLD